MDERLNKAFKSAVDAKKIPGVAAIALTKSGEVLYKGAFGTTNIDDPSAPPFTDATPTPIWSCTKLVTTVAALQLVEQGKLKLDDPVEKYAPKIGKLSVLEGFDEKGAPIYHAPKTKPTILNLMTHTAGFAYDWADEMVLRWRVGNGGEPASLKTYEDVEIPLIFDPGKRYNYGVNIDWLGIVIEAITGLKLEDYVEQNILRPLGMNDTGAKFKGKRFEVHMRGEDGNFTVALDVGPTVDGGMRGGGHYLYSTLNDYSTFLLTILNTGRHPQSGTRILQDETVQKYLFEDHIHKICGPEGIGKIAATIPQLSSDGELLAGVRKGWSCGLMLNLEDAPKGRHAGSGSWAGLSNLYYWIDPAAGKVGLFITDVLPFMDVEALRLNDEFERAVYGHEASKAIGEAGSNYLLSK
jgi:methyl acetate hydrolase